MNKTLKEIREAFRKQYSQIVTNFSYKKISEDDLKIFLDNFPNYFSVIELAKAKEKEKARVEHYKKVVDNKELLSIQLKSQAEDVLQLLEEEKFMTEQGYALEPEKGLRKYNKLRRLDKRISETQATIETLSELTKEIETPKRKVGRPKKNKTEGFEEK